LRDEFGRIYQCPRCNSVLVIDKLFKGVLWCRICGFEDKPYYFRAIPVKADQEEFHEEWNPSRRYEIED